MRHFKRASIGAAIYIVGSLAVRAVSQESIRSNETRFLALAGRSWLNLQVAKFKPGKGWIANTTFYEKPLQGTVFSLFGWAGKLGEVHTTNELAIPTIGVPWEWSIPISFWNWNQQEQCLAIEGSWPAPDRVAVPLPVDDARALSAVVRFLQKNHLDVPQPRLTQVFQIDLLGDGHPVLLIAARSNVPISQDAKPAALYALALLVTSQGAQEKIIPLEVQTSYKPSAFSLENQERLYGILPTYQYVAFLDITGDGHDEIVLTKSRERRPKVDIFSFDGRTVQRVVSTYTID